MFSAVEVYVAAEVGVAIEIDGAVVSVVGAADTDHVKVCGAEFSTPSNTRAVTVYDPAVVGVPEMNPVAEPTKSPGGRPVALYVIGCPSGSLPTN